MTHHMIGLAVTAVLATLPAASMASGLEDASKEAVVVLAGEGDAAVPKAGRGERKEPFWNVPVLETLPTLQALGRPLGSFTLADRLDSHRDLLRYKLGAKDYDVSVAGDPAFKVIYLTLRDADEIQLHRIEDLNSLRGSGVVIEVADKTFYRIKVSVNIFSPTRGSTVKIDPERGTRGPKHRTKTGKVLDAVERESYVFKTRGKEFWMLYGTDVDPETNLFADTRSFLVVHEDGLSSKAWPVAESKLPVDQAVSVDLGGTKVVMRRTSSGQLMISEPGKSIGPVASAY